MPILKREENLLRATNRNRDVTFLVAAATGVVSAALAVVSVVLSTRATHSRQYAPVILTVIGVSAYALLGIYTVYRIRRTRYYDLRIALTGAPRAGKTVFSLLLFDYLMSERDANVKFTAESRSAISTYQSIRRLSQARWPESTNTGSVNQYDGSLRYGRKVLVDLEIGDSAGEYWVNLDDDDRSAGEYLQWVASAGALAHMISVERWIFEDGISGRDSQQVEISQLRLAAQLMRRIRGGEHSPPLLIVITKMDLVAQKGKVVDLMSTYDISQVHRSDALSTLPVAENFIILDALQNLDRELNRTFSDIRYCFSSVDSIAGTPYLPGGDDNSIVEWIRKAALSSRRGR